MNIGVFADIKTRYDFFKQEHIFSFIKKLKSLNIEYEIYLNDFSKEYDLVFIYLYPINLIFRQGKIKSKKFFVFDTDFSRKNIKIIDNLNFFKDIKEIKDLNIKNLNYKILDLTNVKFVNFYKEIIEEYLKNSDNSLNKKIISLLMKSDVIQIESLLKEFSFKDIEKFDDISILYNLFLVFYIKKDFKKLDYIFDLIKNKLSKLDKIENIYIFLSSIEDIYYFNYFYLNKKVKDFLLLKIIFLYIEALSFQKKVYEALSILLDYKNYFKEDYNFLFYLANYFYMNSRISSSLDIFYTLIRKVKFDLISYLNLQSILVYLDKVEDAYELIKTIQLIPSFMYNESLKDLKDENFSIVYLKMANLHFYKKNYMKAKEFILKSLQYKESVYSLNLAGVIYLQQSFPFKAKYYFEKAFKDLETLDVVKDNIKLVKKYTKINFIIFSISSFKQFKNIFSKIYKKIKNINLNIFIYSWDKYKEDKIKFLKNKKVKFYLIQDKKIFLKIFNDLHKDFKGIYSFILQDNLDFSYENLNFLIDEMEKLDDYLFAVSPLIQSHYNKFQVNYLKDISFISAIFTLYRNDLIKKIDFLNYLYSNHFFLFEDLSLTMYKNNIKSKILKDRIIKIKEKIDYQQLKSFKESQDIFYKKWNKILVRSTK